MSEIERRKASKNEVEQRHVANVVVPIDADHVRQFVRDALQQTIFLNPYARAASGWLLFRPLIRFTPVDATHTRIEFDAAGVVRGAETLLFLERRGEIHRFFVAIQDELDRRERWGDNYAAIRRTYEGPIA